jgi:hypothetical protein
VYIDGTTVYSNQETFRFPTNEEIFTQIDSRKG